MIWYCYAIFVVVSFAWFGRAWIGHISRWHIGFMSFSYTLAILSLTLSQLDLDKNPYNEVVTALIVGSGMMGLTRYWLGK